mgnify:CR=1 FL=1
MADVPVVGGDKNVWGTKLNTFLNVAHETSGANGGKVKHIASNLLLDDFLAVAHETSGGNAGKVKNLSYDYYADFNESDHGVTGNGNTIKAYIDAIGSANRSIALKGGDFALATSLTIPPNITLIIFPSARIVKSATVTLTINGFFGAGLYQVFSGFSPGDVTFGNGAIKEVFPQLFGSGTTAIQSAFNAYPNVFFPSGDYLLTAALIFNMNQFIYGVGNKSKIYTNTNNINLMSGLSVNNINIKDLKFVGNNVGSSILNGNGLFFDTCNNIKIKDCILGNFGGGASNDNSAILFYTTCDNVLVENNYIDGGLGTANASDICLYSNISNANIIGNRTLSTNSQGVYALAIGGSIGIVSKNISKNHSRHGILTYSAATKKLIVTDNYCSDNGWCGIYIASGDIDVGETIVTGNYTKSNGTAANPLDGNIAINGGSKYLISNNISENAVRRGIWTSQLSDSIISDNIISSPTEEGILCQLSKDNIKIDGNVIKSPGTIGINMAAPAVAYNNAQITNNTIIEPVGNGISLYALSGSRFRISGNSIKKTGANSLKGIVARYASALKISDNLVDGFDIGISLEDNFDYDNSVVNDNMVRNSITSGIKYYARNVVISNNDMKGNAEDYTLVGATNVSIYYQLNSNRWYYNGQSITRGTAAPTTGTWAQGDICWKTNAAAAGSPGWMCTTGGTPGTWKAMPNLAA